MTTSLRIACAPSLRRPLIHASLMVIVTCACIGFLPDASAQPAARSCGKLDNAYGPYDYRSDKDKLPIVEGAHFTAEVESLVRGLTGPPGGDIDYTLRAFPNHHRALSSMMRLGERLRVNQVPAARMEVECYFMRAVWFRPDDTIVRQLYAIYLGRKGRKSDAMQQLQAAKEQGRDIAFTRYNIGLVYMDLGEHALALQEAHAAAALGFERPELRDRLLAAGKWTEPPTPGGTDAAKAAPSASAVQ
jgi:tetratricopeptide (TPR) repeat protein